MDIKTFEFTCEHCKNVQEYLILELACKSKLDRGKAEIDIKCHSCGYVSEYTYNPKIFYTRINRALIFFITGITIFFLQYILSMKEIIFIYNNSSASILLPWLFILMVLYLIYYITAIINFSYLDINNFKLVKISKIR